MSLAKNVALGLVSLILFFLLLEGALALAGLNPGLYEEDPLVGFSSRIPLFVENEQRKGVLSTARNKLSLFNPQHFVRKKPPEAYRIFCLGGSTTYGRPYGHATSFCGWLRALLPVADPSRRWQLINAGGISYASYRVAALMEELVDYDPDLFIVYSGHNEFLERQTYGRLLDSSLALLESRAFLNQTRSYTLLRRLVAGVTGRRPGVLMKRDVLPDEVDALLDVSIGLRSYHRDDALRTRVLAHYRVHLNRMVDIARSADAEVILVTPASNLRNCTPFKTERRARMTEAERRRWDEAMTRAWREHTTGRTTAAVEAIDQAVEIDPRHASGHYIRGQILYRGGRYADARNAFQRALDEDVCPLRALSEIVGIVAEVAGERDVPLVDFAKFIDERAEHGIPGEDFFLDHVHPTIEGNRLMALELVEAMRSIGVVELDPAWGDAAIHRVTASVEGRIDAEAHARALRNLAKVLTWAGKNEEARDLVRRSLETVKDPEGYKTAAGNAVRLGRFDEAVGYYAALLKLMPDHVPALTGMGYALAQTGRHEEALRSVRKAVRLDPDFELARYRLGYVLGLLGRVEEAIEELLEAARINPQQSEHPMMLGSLYTRLKDHERAAFHYRRALQLDPRLAEAHNRLGAVRTAQGRSSDALRHFRVAVELMPDSAIALARLAWILATDADAEVREGEQAVGFAERACRLTRYKQPYALAGLAAAYAEVGRFEDATRVAQQSGALALAAGLADHVARSRERLALYRAGRPYRSTQ